MTSIWPAEAAHPIGNPRTKHHLYGPADDAEGTSLSSTEEVINALTRSTDSEDSNKATLIANVYTYKDGPQNPDDTPFGQSLVVVGYSSKSSSAAEVLISESEEGNSNRGPCSVGVHRADEKYRKMLDRSRLHNADSFSKFVARLSREDSVAWVRLDKSGGGEGRVGCITANPNLGPLEPKDRGSFAALCHFLPLDDFASKAKKQDASSVNGKNGVADTSMSGVEDDDEVKFVPEDDDDAVKFVPDEDENDDGPTFKPPEDDNDDGPLWQPDGGEDNTTGFGGGDGDGDGGGGLWVPGGNEAEGDDAANFTAPPSTGDDNGFFSEERANSFGENGVNGGATTGHNDENGKQFHKDEGAAAADAFYSNLTRELDSRANSRLFHMRAFNGWVKGQLIAELNPQTTGGEYDDDEEDGDEESHSFMNSNANVAGTKRKRIGGRLPPLRVLDLACGKGGDLNKWTNHIRGLGRYVGIDVARGSLRDAAIRARRMQRTKLRDATFVCADLGSDVPGSLDEKHALLTWQLSKEQDSTGTPEFHSVVGGGITPRERFDIVSVQFAIHYMMQTRKRARRFFKTVSDLLEVGGNLVATTIDARVACQHLMGLGLELTELDEEDAPVIVEVGKGACKLTFEAKTVLNIFKIKPPDDEYEDEEDPSHKKTEENDDDENDADPTHESNFGLQYTFTLREGSDHEAGVGEAVDLPEWLIPLPTLKALAAEAGLELSSAENFHEFYRNRSDPMMYRRAHTALYNMHVLARDGRISEDEWEISRLYVAIKFTKIRQADVIIEEDEEEESGNGDHEQGNQNTDVGGGDEDNFFGEAATAAAAAAMEEVAATENEAAATVVAQEVEAPPAEKQGFIPDDPPKQTPQRPRSDSNEEEGPLAKLSDAAKGGVGGAKVALALMKAKRALGDDMWNVMTTEEKSDAMKAQLTSL